MFFTVTTCVVPTVASAVSLFLNFSYTLLLIRNTNLDLSLAVSYVWVDYPPPYLPLLFSKTCLKCVSGQGLHSGGLCLGLTQILYNN